MNDGRGQSKTMGLRKQLHGERSYRYNHYENITNGCRPECCGITHPMDWALIHFPNLYKRKDFNEGWERI